MDRNLLTHTCENLSGFIQVTSMMGERDKATETQTGWLKLAFGQKT